MGVTAQNSFLPRSVMFLCVGAGLTLLAVQWNNRANPTPYALMDATVATPATAPSQADIKAATGSLNPLQQFANFLQVKLPPSSQKASPKQTALSIPLTSQVVVKLGQRRVFVYEGDRITGQYPLAVGQKGWETPTGSFQVIHMWKNPNWRHPITGQVLPPGPENPLGSRWIGFWSDGHTEIGFHGTNQEELIGQAVSHGCLRMFNRDVEALYQKVAQGTPVVVQP